MQAHSTTKRHGAVPDAILHPTSRTLFGYWNWLRADRSAPGRQEIDLRAIAPILPSVGIIERLATPRGRPWHHCWRLAGTGVARLWGDGLTGTQVAADWPEVYRSALIRGLDGVCERHQPFVARLRAVSARGDEVGIELFAAPMIAASGETDDARPVQALCTVATFRQPSWLGRIPLVDVELSTLAAVGAAPLADEINRVHSRAPSMQLRLIQGGRSD